MFESGNNYDCIQRQKITEWQTTNEHIDTNTLCKTHLFVYADYKDVNKVESMTYAVYCPCGCGDTRNEARICKVCLLSQTRTIYTYYEAVEHSSEYLKLLKKKK